MDCPSYGILRLKVCNVSFHQTGKKKVQQFFKVKNGDGRIVKLPWTSLDDFTDIKKKTQDIEKHSPNEEILIFIGLARGWKGYENRWKENPRCYSIALGIFFNIENIREAKEELFSEIGEEVPNTLPIEIDEDLDCIVCYEPMGLNGASIYQCTEGHLICPKCYDRVRICPVCRKPYGRPPIRNRFAENFAKYNKCHTE